MKIVWQISILFLILFIGAISYLATNKIGYFANVPQSSLYGTWVEKNVAPYSADSFELREDGVYINGARKTRHYDFSDDVLTYQIGEDVYLYRVTQGGLLMREKPFHYTTPFVKKR